MNAAARLLLASASPRRRRLLAWLGVPYAVTSVEVAEDLIGPAAADPPRLALEIARAKMVEAHREAPPGSIVLACDTIVVLDGEVMGKPDDLEDAVRMLRALSGRTHDVVTGVALLYPDAARAELFAVATPVHMRALDDADISAWVREGELMGCAGAYNIERHLAHVDADQCFQNVAGLPLCHVYARLAVFDEPPEGLHSPVGACDAARCAHCLLGPRLAAS